MATRRIKVRGADRRAVLAIGAISGVGLAAADLSPTGSTVVDWVLLLLVGAGAVWASASAPWWALSALAAIAAALAQPTAPQIIGLGVFGLSLAVGVVRRSQPVERATVAGASIVVLSLARELRWFGINSLVAISVVSAVCVLGVYRKSRDEQKLVFQVAAGLVSTAAVAVLGLIAAATDARPDLSEGNRLAQQGLRQLKVGEFDAAQQSFGRAAGAFERADDDLGAIWAQPSRFVPIVAQHRNAGARLASSASSTAGSIQSQLRLAHLDSLRIVDGRIDIEAVRDLQSPMIELQSAIDELDDHVESARSGWLAAPIRRELDELVAEIAAQQDLGDKANAALAVAPAMLGAEGERVYFVMFTTPAEARGQGGFMGNWAEITIDDGRIEMTAFGVDEDLNRSGSRPRTVADAPADWRALYGVFGFEKGPERVVGEVPWKNITMSPHFPSTASVAAELYPQSGGREVDGVISLDVFALEALVGLVGPLDVDGAPQRLSSTNTAEFLLIDQYSIADRDVRRDLLETVARVTIDELLGNNPPALVDLGRALAPLVDQRRVIAWSPRPTEQATVISAGLDGSILPDLGARDGLKVTFNNASGNKIDSFLDRSFDYEVQIDDDGHISATLTMELHNQAPNAGLPDYVIGNLVNLPTGTSRLYVTVHTPLLMVGAQLNGEQRFLTSGLEQGLFAYSTYVDISSKSMSTLTLSLKSQNPIDDYELTIDPQPLSDVEHWTIRSDGATIAATELNEPQTFTLDRS